MGEEVEEEETEDGEGGEQGEDIMKEGAVQRRARQMAITRNAVT